MLKVAKRCIWLHWLAWRSDSLRLIRNLDWSIKAQIRIVCLNWLLRCALVHILLRLLCFIYFARCWISQLTSNFLLRLIKWLLIFRLAHASLWLTNQLAALSAVLRLNWAPRLDCLICCCLAPISVDSKAPWLIRSKHFRFCLTCCLWENVLWGDIREIWIFQPISLCFWRWLLDRIEWIARWQEFRQRNFVIIVFRFVFFLPVGIRIVFFDQH